MNNIAVKLNRANALLLKIRNYVNMKTLRNIYYAIFDSHPTYSCIVWAQNINTVNKLIIPQMKALRIMNRQVPPIFYDWLTFSGDLHRNETCWSVTDHLNTPTFQTQKYGPFSIRASTICSWNSMQNQTIKL